MDIKMQSVGIIFIIVLLLLLALLAAGVVIVMRIKEKLQGFSRLAWGTDSVSDGIKKMKREYSTTPKSVSAMTSLYLPKITADFPEFKYDEAKKRAENVLTYYLLAIEKEKPELLEDANRQLKDKLEAQISMLKNAGQREYYHLIDIHRTEISAYQKKKGRCIITFQAAVQYYYGLTDRNGTPIENNDDMLTQSKYDIDMIYVQDETKVEDQREFGLGLNCPNCGAPLPGLGAKVCEYCESPVVELNLYVWSFGDVREI